MKKNVGRIFAVLLAASLAAYPVTGYTAIVAHAASGQVIMQKEKTISLLGSSDSEEDKDGKKETVYIIADADGNIRETIVSDWLKNPEGMDTIKDQTSLTDIENALREMLLHPPLASKHVPDITFPKSDIRKQIILAISSGRINRLIELSFHGFPGRIPSV